jgi:hypothetical protein
MSKEVRITITKNDDVISSRKSWLPETVLTHHSQAFRNEIEAWDGDYIHVDLLEDGEVVSSFDGSYWKDDFENYDEKISNLCESLK